MLRQQQSVFRASGQPGFQIIQHFFKNQGYWSSVVNTRKERATCRRHFFSTATTIFSTWRMHNSRVERVVRKVARTVCNPQMSWYLSRETSSVGVTFFRSGRTRLEFTAIRVHNSRALGLAMYKGRPNFSDLTRLSLLQSSSASYSSCLAYASFSLSRACLRVPRRFFFNILLSSYEDEAGEVAKMHGLIALSEF